MNEIYLVHLIRTAMQHHMQRPAACFFWIDAVRQSDRVRLHTAVNGTDVSANRGTGLQLPVGLFLLQLPCTRVAFFDNFTKLIDVVFLGKLFETQHP